MADEMDTYHQRKSKRKAKQKPKRKRRNLSVAEEQIQQPKVKKDVKVRMEGNRGCSFTVSVAVPGSILSNAQSPELRTYLAGQVARAIAVFCVNEVIIFDESGKSRTESTNGTFSEVHRTTDPNVLLARILQYLECPQYLRKCFFPKHSDLQYAGVLNPLDTPHHMRMDDNVPYREGVVLDRPVKEGCGSFANVGLRKEVRLDRSLKPGVRVTVKMSDISNPGAKFFKGIVVSPSTPRTEEGLYWGYNVRLASSFGAVFTQSPYKEGYDITVGTSERGTSVQNLQLPKFRHLLVVFGGLKGLEASLESDETLPVSDPSLLFHHYINTCTGQGSGTIRTEEALLITLSALRPIIEQATQWSYN